VAPPRSLFAELKRRNVLRAAVLYVGMIWALSQGISQLTPALGLPDYATRWFLIACAVGFPFWIAFAWFYQWTPQGLRLESNIAAEESIARSTGRRMDMWVIAVLALAVVLLLTNTFLEHKGPGDEADRLGMHDKSIAVLPFENLSADKGNQYFVAGIQDLILTKLADIGDLKVISRTSTARYASRPDDLNIIGRQLGVAAILEGSVQKQDRQVLIAVQLIDTRSNAHIWARSYQRTLDKIFDVEGEVAADVAQALDAKLSPDDSARLAAAPTTNEDAYDLFLRAEYLVRQGDLYFRMTDEKAAIPLYRQAIARDPKFALAYAQLSHAEGAVVWYGSGEDNGEQLIADARAHAEQALALQPDLAAGHLALGSVYLFGREDYAAAIDAFAAALKLRPNDADALALTGWALRRQGHFDAAIEKFQQAFAFNPRDASVAMSLAETYATVGRNAEAMRFYRRTLALDPNNDPAKTGYSALILTSTGDIARALDKAQGDSNWVRSWRVRLLTLQRRYPEALALLAEMPDHVDTLEYQTGPKALVQADLHRLVGDDARARLLYEQALPQAQARLAQLAYSPMKSSFVRNHIAAAQLGLGRTDQALASIAKSQALAVQSGNHFFGPWIGERNAALYAQAGRADLAMPLLAEALATPGIRIYSPILLWLDPAWDPVRHDPGFQALLKKYARYHPAAIPAAASL
jgi:TolB-like protein/cytochrome c-type biogenesis protein CcmH/NrfG